MHSQIYHYISIRIYGQRKLITTTPLDARTNSRTAVVTRISRFASNDAYRERRGPVFSPPFFRLSTRVLIFPARPVEDVKDSSRNRCRSFNPPRIGPDVVLRAASSSPFSRCAPNKSAESPQMPRVVTTLRYVTTLGSMAYLTGMRVTGSSAWLSPRKRAHLTLVPRMNGRAAPSRNLHT